MNWKTIESRQLGEVLYSAVHTSGLRVYVMPKPGYQKSYAVFGTHFGSVDNCFLIPGEKEFTHVPDGIAHYLEHKMFEQPDGGNVFAEYAKFGANANAYTSFDLTAYLFEASEHVEENLKILLDFVQKPYFTDENVAKEQGIIGQEIRMYDDDPGWRVMMNMLAAMYAVHPVGKDIAGTVESIAKINKELLYTCYQTFYHPENMALFVIGDVTPELVERCVSSCIRQREPLGGEIVRRYGEEPASVVKNEVRQKLEVSVPSFMLGFKDMDTGYDGLPLLKKNIELSIIAEAAFGKTSTVYSELYNSGLIMGFLDVETEYRKEYGFLTLSGESREPERVREVIDQGLARIRQQGISQEAFARIRKSFYGKYIKQFNNITAVAHGFMSNIFNGIGPFDFAEALDTVTLDDVNHRLKASLSEDLSVLSVIEA